VTDPTPGDLPEGFVLRRPRDDDLDCVVALIAAADTAVSHETCASRDDLHADWNQPRFELDRNAWLVVADDGRPAAYAWVLDSADHTSIDGQFLVHPEYQWRGLEAPLLDWIERFAAAPAATAAAGRRVSLGLWCDRGDRRAELYRGAGYAHVRSFLRLRMTLDRLPDDPLVYAPPRGLEVRRFVRDRDERATWATCQEAFADHFRYSPQPLEEWLQSSFTEGVDTDLWFTAWDGDRMVGYVICYAEPYGGYVDQLAVRRPWRRRGLGRLLLLTAFAALHERGCPEAVLGVDAENENGAVGLYERLGMRASLTHDFYEKILRDRR
jgi:ribosomal protein S18 acetylase RimI-like enzyme